MESSLHVRAVDRPYCRLQPFRQVFEFFKQGIDGRQNGCSEFSCHVALELLVADGHTADAEFYLIEPKTQLREKILHVSDVEFEFGTNQIEFLPLAQMLLEQALHLGRLKIVAGELHLPAVIKGRG